MNILKQDELKRKIKSGDIAPMYFMYGDEPYLINFYIDLILQNTVTALPEINIKNIDGDFNVDKIIAEAYQVPMMSLKRVIVLNDFDLSKLSQKDFEKLLDAVSKPSDVSVIIFKYISIPIFFEIKSKAKNLHKNYSTLASAIEKNGGVVSSVNHLTIGETAKILQSGAAKRKCLLSYENARYLVEYCSPDLTALLCEIEKLCSYINEGEITKEVIDKICTKNITAVVYDISKAIFNKDIARSVSILNTLIFEKVKETDILRELSQAYINIFRVMYASKCGVNKNTLATDFNYGARAFLLNNAETLSKKMSEKCIFEIIGEILKADVMLKGGSKAKKSDILQMLIVKLHLIAAKER